MLINVSTEKLASDHFAHVSLRAAHSGNNIATGRISFVFVLFNVRMRAGAPALPGVMTISAGPAGGSDTSCEISPRRRLRRLKHVH